MDPAEEIVQLALTRQCAMNAVIDRGDSPVQEFYRGATVLVTGGSGFLGKQLIEKLFRSTQIKKMFVLIRQKKTNTPEQRISTVLKDPIFDLLHKNQPDFVQKIVPIAGDVAELELGISLHNKELILNEVEIIFHMAATVAFDHPIKSAILTNVRGTRDIINLGKQCKNLKSFLHVSTAYTNATLSRVGENIKEEFYPAPMPPDLMIELAESVEEDRLNEMKEAITKGWPNTYTFTKVLAEDIVRKNIDQLPIKVVRPTIIICANREPNPGWIDISSVFGPSGLVLGLMMGVLHVIISRHEIKIDFIPSDYVANLAIVAATTRTCKIYTAGSSNRNPFTWGSLSNTLKNEVTKFMTPQIIWYAYGIETSSSFLYKIYDMFAHKIPGYIADGACLLLMKKPKLGKIYATVDKLISVLKYFTTHEWTFIDQNTIDLYNSLCERDRAIYHFDVADVDWIHQVVLWSVGLRKYIVKDGLKDTAWGIKKQSCFRILHYIAVGLMLSLVFYVSSWAFKSFL